MAAVPLPSDRWRGRCKHGGLRKKERQQQQRIVESLFKRERERESTVYQSRERESAHQSKQERLASDNKSNGARERERTAWMLNCNRWADFRGLVGAPTGWALVGAVASALLRHIWVTFPTQIGGFGWTRPPARYSLSKGLLIL
eukprot:scaffold122050_cov52-Attheya_sp.AAC.3